MLVLLPFWALGFPLASLIEPVVLSSCCVGARRSAHGMSQAVVVLWGRQLVVAGCRCCRRCCWFVFGVGCLVFGVWCSKFGVWCSKCGVQSAVFGVWWLGAWCVGRCGVATRSKVRNSKRQSRDRSQTIKLTRRTSGSLTVKSRRRRRSGRGNSWWGKQTPTATTEAMKKVCSPSPPTRHTVHGHENGDDSGNKPGDISSTASKNTGSGNSA